MQKNCKIFLSGHNGLLGSSIFRLLKKKNFKNIIIIEKKKLDLRNQKEVNNFIKTIKPYAIINAAAKVGGIKSNSTYKADFIYDNIAIQTNLIHSAFKFGVKNFIFFGSSCIYPKNINRPIKELDLLSGPLEISNEPYAIAKIAGIKMCESYNFQHKMNFKCLMPCNTFGPNDNYDLFSSHFLPAIIRKICEAKIKKKKSVIFWGTGKPKRELIYVDDLAEATLFFLQKKTKESLLNIGSGYEKSIKDYVKLVCSYADYYPEIFFKNNKLDGVKRKIMNSSIAKKYGWRLKHNIDKNIKGIVKDFLRLKS